MDSRSSRSALPGHKVYVDASIWPLGRMMMCHMVADRVEDLHAMADKIGVSRKWFQCERYPHYDICMSKRAMAVKHGAVEIGRREFAGIANRLIGTLTTKDSAVALLHSEARPQPPSVITKRNNP